MAANKYQYVLNQNPANAVAGNPTVVTPPGLQISQYPGNAQPYAVPTGVQYVIDIMYVIEGLLEISNGTVDLQI